MIGTATVSMTDAAPVSGISPIEEIIAEARAGRMFILVDHEDRENEGDLVIPACAATPEAVNFMAMHARGLICLTLTGERIDELGLSVIEGRHQPQHGTAFTQSIDARDGITTGISTFDRARTIEVAASPKFGAADIVTPGHMFPLRARDGGVLVRPGHTEASVDISRLAGLTPAAVICEVIREDGTMARLPDLVDFARLHGLKIGTISDLIAWRRRHDALVHEVERRVVTSQWGGEWDFRVFRDSVSGADHIALTKGDLADPAPLMTRVHAIDTLSDMLGIEETGTPGTVPLAMQRVAEEGRGAIVLLRATKKVVSFRAADSAEELTDYGLGAQILSALGATRLHILTSSDQLSYAARLENHNLTITQNEPLDVSRC